jgi:hypothetical protein
MYPNRKGKRSAMEELINVQFLKKKKQIKGEKRKEMLDAKKKNPKKKRKTAKKLKRFLPKWKINSFLLIEVDLER